jgi:hypothetical protein
MWIVVVAGHRKEWRNGGREIASVMATTEKRAVPASVVVSGIRQNHLQK